MSRSAAVGSFATISATPTPSCGYTSRTAAFLREVSPPGFVSIVGDPIGHGSVEGSPDRDVFYFRAVSFVESGALWSHDIATGRDHPRERLGVAGRSWQQFVTEQVFAPSGDGTQVPMFLTRRRDVRADGRQKALLYGYGGFDIPLTPSFGVTFATWLDRGGSLGRRQPPGRR